MTTGDGPPDGLVRYADELRAWAAVVDDAADAIGSLVAALPGAWADAAGREWTERLQLAGVELTDRAGEAEHLARDVKRAGRGPDTGDPTGVRLGGQSGTRVTGRRGVVVPVLPPP